MSYSVVVREGITTSEYEMWLTFRQHKYQNEASNENEDSRKKEGTPNDGISLLVRFAIVNLT